MAKNPFKKIGKILSRNVKTAASNVNHAINRIDSTADNVASTIERTANRSVNAVSILSDKLINGANTFSPSAKAILRSHGDKQIVGLSIVRNPIPAAVQGIMDNFGGRIGVDRLMHLALVWHLDDGTRGICEKNEVINISKGPLAVTSDGASMDVSGPFTTLNTMMTNTKNKMGRLMFSYSVTNNCQKFVEAVLVSNGLANDENIKFVVQETDNLFKGKADLRKFANTVTDIAGRANMLFQGGNIRPYVRSGVRNMGPMSISGGGLHDDDDDDEFACLMTKKKKGVVCRG